MYTIAIQLCYLLATHLVITRREDNLMTTRVRMVMKAVRRNRVTMMTRKKRTVRMVVKAVRMRRMRMMSQW